jgi:hypothetical protein
MLSKVSTIDVRFLYALRSNATSLSNSKLEASKNLIRVALIGDVKAGEEAEVETCL